jgi:hypothetical protein
VYETPIEQAGLRKERGEREEIVKISELWRAQGSIKKCQTVS